MLNCSICHIIIRKFFLTKIFALVGRRGGGGVELKYLGTLPFGTPPQNLFRKAKLFPEKKRGEGGLLFPKTKRPKIFSKTLVLHNGLNLVFKTFFDLNFPKPYNSAIPAFASWATWAPFFYFSLGGGGRVAAPAMPKPRVWSSAWGAENQTEGHGNCAIVIALIYDQGPVVQTLIG